MHLTQGAIGNLINRYRAVLRKCRLLNTFGSLAVAGLLVLGPCSAAHAEQLVAPWTEKTINQTQLDFPVHNTMEIKDNATISIGGLSGVDIRNGWVFPATVTQTGGSILVTDTTSYANGEYGGILSIRNVTYHLQGGSIHVGPLSIMNVEDDLIISGGSLKNEGQFAATRLDLSNAGNALSNTGFLSISSELLCSDAQLKDLVAASTASLLIEGTSSRQYSVTDLGQSATLDAGMFSADVDARQKVVIGERGSLEAQTVTLNGDTFSINKDGRIKTNVLNLNNSGSNFTVTSGKLVLNGGSAADTELVLGEFNSETGVPSSGGTLDANVTATSGTVSVVAGTWTLASGKTINIGSGGVLNVGGVMDTGYSNVESLPAKLIVNGSLLSADAGNGTRGINILAGGTLEAGKNVLLSGTNRVNGLNVINTAANGTLRVTGLGTITKTDLAAIQGNLMTGAGLFDIADAIIDDAQVAPDGTIDYATLPPGGVTSDTCREAVVINVDGPLAAISPPWNWPAAAASA